MGDDVRLVVKVSEKSEHLKQRIAEKYEKEKFYSTLNISKQNHKSDDDQNGEEFEMDETELSCQNPLQPSFKTNVLQRFSQATSVSSQSNSLFTNETQSTLAKSLSSEQSSSSITGMNDGSSLQNGGGLFNGDYTTVSSTTLLAPSTFNLHSKFNNCSKPNIMSPSTSKCNDVAQTISKPYQSPVCTYCGKPSGKKCAACKIPYCTVKCQNDDWERHRDECKVLSSQVRE